MRGGEDEVGRFSGVLDFFDGLFSPEQEDDGIFFFVEEFDNFVCKKFPALSEMGFRMSLANG